MRSVIWPNQTMQNFALEVVVASALAVIPETSELRPASYATWAMTREEDDFDAPSVIDYLKREGHEVDVALILKYGESNPKPIRLQEVESIAPWIECLPESFVEYQSFRPLRENPKYIEILTFTTPVLTETRDLAFLEVWEEDGRYSNMGTWWWMQMRFTNGSWKPDWQHIHAIS